MTQLSDIIEMQLKQQQKPAVKANKGIHVGHSDMSHAAALSTGHAKSGTSFAPTARTPYLRGAQTVTPVRSSMEDPAHTKKKKKRVISAGTEGTDVQGELTRRKTKLSPLKKIILKERQARKADGNASPDLKLESIAEERTKDDNDRAIHTEATSEETSVDDESAVESTVVDLTISEGSKIAQESHEREEEKSSAEENDAEAQHRCTEQTHKEGEAPLPMFQGIKVREYVDQQLSVELDEVVGALVADLHRFQERMKAMEPLKAKMRRRMVTGLREVTRGIKANKIKSIICAPNIEKIATQGGLDDKIAEILQLCKERDVPVVYALSKGKLGKALGKPLRVSVIGIYNYDGAHELYKKMIDLACNKLRPFHRS
eukprot:GILK01009984.1.p1 GENE.GILK01009984.1~~GILK01009984.1.p1  ORF type:complete len:406 (-),score=71.13 GILK01009984.1:90-1208(-)